MDIKERLTSLLEEYELNDDHVQYELDLMVKIIDFIKTLDNDILDDESYNAIGESFESLLDVIISLEDDDLDDDSTEALQDLFLDIEELDSLEEATYKPRKIKAGRAKSIASRMTGTEKMKYIKRLKANKKKYKTNATLRLKTKKKGKKYRKTAKGKQKIRTYKQFNK